MTYIQKSKQMNTMAEKHSELGNTVLATWFKENALRLKSIAEETDRILDKMALGNYTGTTVSARNEFTEQWYSYEEEYAYNFCGY